MGHEVSQGPCRGSVAEPALQARPHTPADQARQRTPATGTSEEGSSETIHSAW